MTKLGHLVVALALAGFALLCCPAIAQVPQLINYQGRVSVDGVNFSGTAQFKFALVDGPGTTTYWSNDGTTGLAVEPTASVSLTVTNGLYSVLLGNTVLPGMTGIPSSVFNNADVRLRVWFDDGVHGFQLLTPDERIAAVGYAMKAAFASTVSDGAITAEKIAAGAVVASLNAGGQSGVASGGLILSLTENSALVSAGYVKIGTASLDGLTSYAWQAAPAPAGGTPPSQRSNHSAVWTGTEMIVWGGTSNGVGSGALDSGGRYNPVTNIWTPVAATDAPAARMAHTAVWTGTEMIVWGGEGAGGPLNSGGRYNPTNDTWTPITLTSAPAARTLHSAAWSGSKMILWGGSNGSGALNDGGRYDPGSGTWAAVTSVAAPVARDLHTAVWTGSEMVVWGGTGATGALNSGGRYNPGTDSWTAVTTADAPYQRNRHTAVWAGSRMIVWGGFGDGYRNDGARYNPANDSWQSTTTNLPPTGRFKHSAVWTGTEMIIWGGFGGAFLNSSGRYDPGADTWSAIAPAGAPINREGHTAVWTGNRMIAWGGFYSNGSDNFLNDMWFLASVPQTMHLYQKP